MQFRIYHHQEIDFSVEELDWLPYPNKLLMVTPAYFDVVDVRNAYMDQNVGKIDKEVAWEQWNTLHAVFMHLKSRGFLQEVEVMEGQPGLVDMVFAANQTLPWLLREGQKIVVLSRMRNSNRQLEVAHFRHFFEGEGYSILELPEGVLLEGNGDIIPHPTKRLVWAGYGHRSSLEAVALLPDMLQCPVIPLHLVNEHFYHLDTCFLPVDEQTVLLCAEAFDGKSLDAIGKLFAKVVYIALEEAVNTFALNALVLSQPSQGKVAVIQKGASTAINALSEAGCEVIEVQTGEFMKSGGSVFCMKMLYW